MIIKDSRLTQYRKCGMPKVLQDGDIINIDVTVVKVTSHHIAIAIAGPLLSLALIPSVQSQPSASGPDSGSASDAT